MEPANPDVMQTIFNKCKAIIRSDCSMFFYVRIVLLKPVSVKPAQFTVTTTHPQETIYIFKHCGMPAFLVQAFLNCPMHCTVLNFLDFLLLLLCKAIASGKTHDYKKRYFF